MNSQKKFLKTVLIWALAIRVALAVVLTAGGLTYKLRLSPDSERYHRVALEINADIENKVSTRYTWQDHGWFRFTALVYRVFGAHSWIIQACNITFSGARINCSWCCDVYWCLRTTIFICDYI